MTDLPNHQLSSSAQVSAVSDATSKNALSADEKKEQNREFAKVATHHEMYAPAEKLTNHTDIPREIERRAPESEQTSWLAKNIHHLLALGIMGLTFGSTPSSSLAAPKTASSNRKPKISSSISWEP